MEPTALESVPPTPPISVASPAVQLARLQEVHGKQKLKRAALDAKIAEMEQDIAALKRVLDRNLLDERVDADDDGPAPAGYGRVREAVLEVANSIEKDFSTGDVWEILIATPAFAETSRGAVNNALNRLADDGQIERVASGIGKRSPVFRRIIKW